MLALARGLGTDPSVLLIDELSMGLAPMVVGQLYDAVVRVAEEGVSVLVVEQFATVGLRYASACYVMAHGVITYAGSSENATAAVHAAYLGSGT
jgi:branched-chain amino acid transport system ATP-binding protein